MNGKGHCVDNVLVVRLWRSIKYEEVYLKRYETMVDVHHNLDICLRFYNERRPYSTHGRQTPFEVYHRTGKVMPISSMPAGGIFTERQVGWLRKGFYCPRIRTISIGKQSTKQWVARPVI